MDKFAQRRSFLNKLREKANITGRMLESMNPEFREVMERMRATDENARNYADGLKSYVRSAQSFVRRRDYLSAATQISAFHERCRYITAELDKFNKSIDLKHYKFLLEQFDDEQKEKLFGYDPSKEINLENTAEDFSRALIKQAGPSDWWFNLSKALDPVSDVASNLLTGKGQAMRGLEKRFSTGFLKALKVNTENMVNKSEDFLNTLLRIFKQLAVAVAKRNLDLYKTLSTELVKKFTTFHSTFIKYYDTNVVPLKNKHEELQAETRKAIEDAEAKRLAEKNKWHVPEARPSDAVRPKSLEVQPSSEQVLNKLEDKLGPEENQAPDSGEVAKAAQHEFLINKLLALASKNDIRSMTDEILKYSETIEDSDPETSLKLLSIAEGILENKTAGIFDKFLGKKQPPKLPEQPQDKRPLV